MSRNVRIKYALDWTTVIMFLGLVLFGWLNIYGASYTFDQTNIFDFGHRAGKQFIWILTAFGLGGILLLIDSKMYNLFAYIAYGVVVALLIITPFLAEDVKGSRSWLSLGPVSLQPAEFAKVATALAIARFMNTYGYKVRSLKDLFIPALLIFIPFFLIMIPQKETGSALVFVSFLLMFYREGMNGIILWLTLIAIVFFVIVIRFGTVPLPIGTGTWGFFSCMLFILLLQVGMLFFKERKKKETAFLSGGIVFAFLAGIIINNWYSVNFNYLSIGIILAANIYLAYIALVSRKTKLGWVILFSICSIIYCFSANYAFENILQPHQKTRIEVLLGITDDPQGDGYNVNQSKIAIGSGGFAGKGFLNGTQTKLKYVPEQDTDFIFCTVGEEWGFLGTAGVLIVYWLFLMRLLKLAERQKDTFSRVYGYCVASIFFFHLMINVGMVLGVMPVIGIPVPFFSYGGSSLWGFTILLFIFLRLDAARLEKLR